MVVVVVPAALGIFRYKSAHELDGDCGSVLRTF